MMNYYSIKFVKFNFLFLLILFSNQLFAQDTIPQTFKQGVKIAFDRAETIYNFEELTDLFPIKNQVVILSVQQNSLTEFPIEIKAFSNLEELDLSHNQIESINYPVIQTLTHLKKLYLNGNPLMENQLVELKNRFPHVEIYFYPNQFN